MKVKIPKDLVGASYPVVTTIVLAEFNTDIFLPALFFKVMSGGKSRAKLKNDEKAIGMYVEKLANHHLLAGFETPDGRRVLEKFVRTTLITTGAVGRAKQGGEQIMALTPYSLLSYKPGFPAESRRQRGVDTFIYHVLREHLQAGASLVEAQANLKTLIVSFFGKGLKFDRTPGSTEATYDEQTQLDTLTRMSLAFIDGFQATGFGREIDTSKPSPCPTLVTHLAQDVLLFLNTYSERMPSQALTYYFQALIGFEMYSYSLRLVTAVNQLVRNQDELPLAMRTVAERSEPLIYLDFIGRSGHLSQQMAAECVRRDIETFQQFFNSMLQLRWLDRQVSELKGSASSKKQIAELLQGHTSGATYLQIMLQMRNNPDLRPDLNAAARAAIRSIREATLPEQSGGSLEELQWLDEIIASAETDIDQLILLLEEGQRQSVLKNYMGWIIGVGGMGKAYGLIAGVPRQRRTWRYAPGNDLLSLFVQLATAHAIPQNQRGAGATPREIRLQEFLLFLEQRYGIIIDRPPPGMSGAEYSAAARENLRAMLGRLRQMGIFTDLSDDFTVQRLRPPYGDQVTTGQERY
ncbi:MAG: methylation-associated defense system protein MAD7 [Oscillochloridaceae bacterium umkhey_bin13]